MSTSSFTSMPFIVGVIVGVVACHVYKTKVAS